SGATGQAYKTGCAELGLTDSELTDSVLTDSELTDSVLTDSELTDSPPPCTETCRLLTLLLLACCCCLAASQAGAADLENRELRVVTITRELKFRYRIYEVADSRFGSRSPKGVWNGLMGDIVNKTADLTLATLRIMPKRLEAVDFTLPVSSSGLSLLYKEAASQTLQTSQAALLLQPFAASTWVLLLLVYIIYLGLAFVLFLLSPTNWAVAPAAPPRPSPKRGKPAAEPSRSSLAASSSR
uniref:Lig_chan-Glu_bd domain-containing protein n=1 Tax=Macrostomum lignano TaxID=282301 RepID=A0A1I8IHF0_9PLAT